jgi:hypothetical protein
VDKPGYDFGILAGLLGPRTEQFALGSIYYYINYGIAVYEDKTLTEVPRDRGVVLNKLIRDMQCPDLDCDPMIDELIHKCWYNQFPTIASLAVATKALLNKKSSSEEEKAVNDEINTTLVTDGGESHIGNLTENSTSKEALCREFGEHGLFDFLRSSRCGGNRCRGKRIK